MTLLSCRHVVKRSNYAQTNPKASNCRVVWKRNEIPPPSLEYLGTIRIKDSGFSMNCSEEEAMLILYKEACSLNAEFIYIMEEKPAGLSSTCYQCTAEFYRLPSEKKEMPLLDRN